MTFEQIVQKVMDRTNLTSDDARTRIGDEVNEMYRELTVGTGMETTVRGESTTSSVMDSRYITFGGEEDEDDKVVKIMAVWLPNSVAPPPYNVLTSITFDEMRNTIPGTWPPQFYAISRTGPTSVQLFLDAVAPDDAQVLNADVMKLVDELAGSDQPFFPTNFHNVLVYGVMAIELDIMEKDDRAQLAQKRYESIASELRMHFAKDAYIRIHQGKTMGGWIGSQLVPS